MNKQAIANCKREGYIGIIELQNPPHNYLESPVFVDKTQLEKMVDDGIKGLLIKGAGRHFSAGANIDTMQEQIKSHHNFAKDLTKGNALLDYIDELPIPVIASISGVCFGAGLELALAADIRVCEEKALFAFPEVTHDLTPGMGGLKRLTEIVGKATAIEIGLKGDMIGVDLAENLKLVDVVKLKGEAWNFAMDLLLKMTANRPLRVIQAVMQSIHFYQKLTKEEATSRDIEMFCELAKDAFTNNENV